ncbi:MAG: hypothetical protein M1434_11655 [Chloroflexi bacterium]|nr:hypothetical protein [Chloroflexota bacterium]MCL5275378.1 hypothetical protein [Chloroflexota bacterium]
MRRDGLKVRVAMHQNCLMRERFIQTLNFQPAHPPFVRNFGAWEETQRLWRERGWDGRPLDDIFNTDTLLRVEVGYGPAPEYTHQVLAEDETTCTYINHEGILMREFKQHRDTSMPQFIRFPVVDKASFSTVETERLGLQAEIRFTPQWEERVHAMRESGMPRQCWADRWGGFFGPLRNLMGVENLCLAFYDQPRLVERMMAQRAESIIAITERILQHTDFETFWFWEDMAYNAGPLVDPRMYRRFALPHYRRVCDWLC